MASTVTSLWEALKRSTSFTRLSLDDAVSECQMVMCTGPEETVSSTSEPPSPPPHAARTSDRMAARHTSRFTGLHLLRVGPADLQTCFGRDHTAAERANGRRPGPAAFR